MLKNRNRRASIPLAGVILVVLSLGPATASATGPRTGEYECYSYIGQGYISGYFTVQGADSYRWVPRKTDPLIRVPGSGTGKFKVNGERLIFVSGPFVSKQPKKSKKKVKGKKKAAVKPKYRASWAQLSAGTWTLEFIPINPKAKPGRPRPVAPSYIDCVQVIEVDEPEI